MFKETPYDEETSLQRRLDSWRDKRSQSIQEDGFLFGFLFSEERGR